MKKISAFLILSASVLMTSCWGKQGNAEEKRILGTWEQEGGSGEIANLNIKITYSFESRNKFKMLAKGGGKVFQSLAGSYEIKTDSLFLYYEGGVDNTNYSGKVIFNSDTKFALIDLNGELDFSKK